MNLFRITFLLYTYLYLVASLCPGSLPPGTSYTCGASNVLTPSSFSSFISGQKVLTISFDIQITGLCSITTPLSLLILTIQPSGLTSPIKIFDFRWLGSTSYNINTEDTTGVRVMSPAAHTASTSAGVGTWSSFYGTVDLASNLANAGMVIPGYTSDTGDTLTSLSYGGSWSFDSTTKVFVCSSASGANSASCLIKNFKLWYSYLGDVPKAPYLWGLSPNLLGNYRFHDQNEFFVIDSAGSLGPGQFGASKPIGSDTISSPRWSLDEGGIVFSTVYQYIQVPVFMPVKSTGLSAYSVTVSFWIKLTKMVASTIFRYSSSDLSVDRFSISNKATGQVMLTVGSASITADSTMVLRVDSWSLVTASFVLETYVGSTNNLLFLYVDGNLVASTTTANTGTVSFLSTDVVRIGGPTKSFLGVLKDLSIYSPGSLLVNNQSSCSSHLGLCAAELGLTTPSTCLSCPSGSGNYNQECISCPAGYFLQVPNCTACPTNCANCLNATKCLTCNSPYNLLDGTCTTCADGFFASQSSCIGCPETCSKCSSASTCLTCESGYGLYDFKCIICARGMYLSSGVCNNCPAHCQTCESATECSSCLHGYALSDDLECVVEEKENNEEFVVLLVFMIIEAAVIGILVLVVCRKWYLKTENTNLLRSMSRMKELKE